MKNIRSTSVESYEAVCETMNERYSICLNGLRDLEFATANELAMYLFKKEVLPYFNRNFVHPRLTELVAKGWVEEVEKRTCAITNKKCIVYRVA